MRTLVHVIHMDGFNDIKIFQRGNTVHMRGEEYGLPSKEEFESFEEAKAFVRGICWAIGFYRGAWNNYMQDID